MATVTLNRPNLYPFKHLLLMPGENEISAEDAKMLRAQPGVMRDVERGVLTLKGGGTRSTKPAAPAPEPEKTEAE